MPRFYRALISVPISADDDEQAERIALTHAHSLMHPGTDVVAGHLELLGEAREGHLEITRTVMADPAFEDQIAPDPKKLPGGASTSLDGGP